MEKGDRQKKACKNQTTQSFTPEVFPTGWSSAFATFTIFIRKRICTDLKIQSAGGRILIPNKQSNQAHVESNQQLGMRFILVMAANSRILLPARSGRP